MQQKKALPLAHVSTWARALEEGLHLKKINAFCIQHPLSLLLEASVRSVIRNKGLSLTDEDLSDVWDSLQRDLYTPHCQLIHFPDSLINQRCTTQTNHHALSATPLP
jgi:hypothetical protein